MPSLALQKASSDQKKKSNHECTQMMKRTLSATNITSRPSFLKNRQKRMKLSDFLIGSVKGKGRFGKVYQAIHRKTGWMVALK